MHPFTQGVSYNREDILNFVGSRQPQSGIVHSAAQDDYVAVFTGGRSAKPVGYRDGWEPDGTFRYHGQGAKGDQKLARGNRVLAEHQGVVLLFETWKPRKSWKGRQRFIGDYVVSGYAWENGQGTRNGDRILVFTLVPTVTVSAGATKNELGTGDALDLQSLRASAVLASRPSSPSYCSAQQFRARSEAVAKYVAARANGVCEACGFEAPFHRPDGSPYLEIHHIHRLADDGPDDIMHVSAICPNCHREAHFGVNKDGFRDRLGIAVAEREREYALPNTAGTDGEAMGVVRLQNRKGGSHGSV